MGGGGKGIERAGPPSGRAGKPKQPVTRPGTSRGNDLYEETLIRKALDDSIGPFDDQDPLAHKALIEAEVQELARAGEPVGVVMVDRKAPLINLLQDVGRTVHLPVIGTVEAMDEPSREGRLAATQLTDEGHDVAVPQQVSEGTAQLVGLFR